jgi:phosphoribosylformimino-5-aminoimidazole carboxamide ribotide isomerase
VIGSVAVTDTETVKEWIESFGADKIVLALDVRVDDAGTPRLATEGWTKTSTLSLWQCVDEYRQVQVAHILCTDVSRDGAMAGPNTDLYRQFVQRYPEIRLQASGGVRGIADLEALRTLGASAAITGRALLDGQITAQEIASFQQSA